jgi:hypothetical protein
MTAPRDICDALEANDRAALRAAIDAFLDSLGANEPIKARVERLLVWVRTLPCIATAELNPDLLDVEPPIREVRLTLRDGGRRTLGIVLDRDRLRFDHR